MTIASLETATHPEQLRRVAIDPVSRVEGHGKVTILLDDDNKVHQVRLHIVEFRGFEKFIQGRPYWEVPVMVQRLCGICPVSHHLAASKAFDRVLGVKTLTPTAEKIRRLMHYGQIMQSHALHFFHLSSPDLLFGFDSEVAKRNIVGVAEKYPEVAKKGVLLRKFGQEVIRITAGKRIHGTGAIPGGVNKAVTVAERDELLEDIYQMIAWSREAVQLVQQLHEANPALYDSFGLFRSSMMSLVGNNGEMDLYHGELRARDEHGQIIFDGVDYQDYGKVIEEEVKPWTYMKFPFIKSLGRADGWYKVGPLARVQNCDSIPTPFAEAERRNFVDYAGGTPFHGPLAYHWTRMIEMLHAVEVIKDLLHDDDILGRDLMATGVRQREGVGVIEAPRGTLFHHYQVDENDLVTMCNLIVSTTNNNQPMNEAVRQVARRYLHGQEITEGLLNHIEVAIRAFDPCLSCATHALGKMPLEVELLDAAGEVVSRLAKSAHGEMSA
jgi:NAD-reducing hydrogenase large subunit